MVARILMTERETDSDSAPIVRVVRGVGIDSENSDLKTNEEIYAHITANYELVTDQYSAVGYACVLKSGGTPIQFYADGNECTTYDIFLDQSSGTTIETAWIKFPTVNDPNYGVRVVMNDNISIFDDRD